MKEQLKDVIDVDGWDQNNIMKSGKTCVILFGSSGFIGKNLYRQFLKFNDKYAQYAYDHNFKFPTPPIKPEVSAFGGDKEIFLDWGNDYNLNNIENYCINHSEKECNKCLMDNFCLSFKIVV